MISDRTKFLAGLRVIDLTSFLSGPAATQILGDLGAEVIKVESPDGDSSRNVPPHFVEGESIYYLSTNSNKSSIALDLREPKGRSILDNLIRVADVVIDNFRPGARERLGLDPREYLKKSKDLIWVSITGFGQSGSQRDKPAYDMIVQALSGVMSLTGIKGGDSVRLGIPAGDLVAGLFAVIGILANLHYRAKGGGRWLDISMLEGQLYMTSYQAAYTLYTNKAADKQGAQHDFIPTYRLFRGRDSREIVVTANTDRMWENLCKALELENLIRDQRFVDLNRRYENRSELIEILQQRFLEKSAKEWLSILSNHDVPCALVRNTLEALHSAAEESPDLIRRLISSEGKLVQCVTTPIKIVDEERGPDRYPPRLDENREEILKFVS